LKITRIAKVLYIFWARPGGPSSKDESTDGLIWIQ